MSISVFHKVRKTYQTMFPWSTEPQLDEIVFCEFLVHSNDHVLPLWTVCGTNRLLAHRQFLAQLKWNANIQYTCITCYAVRHVWYMLAIAYPMLHYCCRLVFTLTSITYTSIIEVLSKHVKLTNIQLEINFDEDQESIPRYK